MANRLDTRFIETEQYQELVDVEIIAEDYLRCNQSFTQMVFDEFVTLDKTNASYQDKVDIKRFKMTPGNAGSWYSKTWTIPSSVTVCKVRWRTSSDFDHDIEISADNGSNWETVSTGGAKTNMDTEITINNPGTSVILRALNGTQGSLLGYIILVK